ncbi:phage tail assembly chaperone [Heyndrickxia oleronia]|uniref:phage tail assembly chaperone n=1 Tax=Heyndrickxia oleronia TaxID=38875 RepID=UPI001B2BBC5F|nr:hypothetical protein [Heyndrickxia oleronia]GIN39606.1 hypothetical protein J19TS1_25550 [Heyndrickxia oleronia]
MTDMLQALLGTENNAKGEVYIKRLGGYFQIRSIDSQELNSIKEQATHFVGKGVNREEVIDDLEFKKILISKACINPDFNNDDLKQKYGAVDAADCVEKSLLPGEIAKLIEEIFKLSGFDDSEEEIEAVKN